MQVNTLLSYFFFSRYSRPFPEIGRTIGGSNAPPSPFFFCFFCLGSVQESIYILCMNMKGKHAHMARMMGVVGVYGRTRSNGLPRVSQPLYLVPGLVEQGGGEVGGSRRG